MIRPHALAACSLVALLGGCGSVPREYHYTLNAQPAAAAATAPQSSFSIAVGPVTVPEMVDQPQMVVQAAPNRVAIEEYRRWASPLRSEIALVIAANLSQMLNASREGEDVVEPASAIYGPKVMIVNQMSGSGGDALPWLFKQTHGGTLVGQRSWGEIGRAHV